MAEVIAISLEQLRVAKRIEQSCGYLEFGMARHALENVAGLASQGALEGALQYVRGQALRMQERYGDAVAPLEAAAELLPEGATRHVWLALADCHRANSAGVLAANTLALARGAKQPLG
jgi:predicted Zn-dependent protease